MRIAICDDNGGDAQKLAAMLGGAHSHRIFSSAEGLLFEIEEQKEIFDLYLLDIFMGGMDGIELGKRIRGQSDGALICYISSSPDYYAEAFRMYAFQYLLKPVEEGAFNELLRRASEQFVRDSGQSVKLSCRGKNILVPYGRILYISSMGHTLFVHCKDGTILRHYGRLDAMAAFLDETVFARCHQSFIVNLYNVSGQEGDCFYCGTERIPISRRYAAIKEQYRALLFADMD